MYRRNWGRQLCLVAVAVLAFALPALAQDGSAQGKVTDVNGKPIADAKVMFEFIGSGRKFETKSDKNGEYLQVGLIQGPYTITVEKEGIGKVSKNIQIRGARRNPFDVVLAPGAGEAATVDPKLLEANKIINEGVALSQAGNQDGAIEKFNAALALNPKCFDCFYNLGAANAQKKDYDKAVDNYKKSIEIKPTAEAYNGLANVYNAQKKFAEATAASTEATKLAAGAGGATGSPDAMYNQGVILFNQGKIDEAKPLFEQVIAAAPNNADAHYMYGMTLAGADPAKAVSEFETYLKLAPTGKNAPLAKQFVDALKK
jgi:tetratricopeptide (TPR) repeat protein